MLPSSAVATGVVLTADVLSVPRSTTWPSISPHTITDAGVASAPTQNVSVSLTRALIVTSLVVVIAIPPASTYAPGAADV